MKVVSDSMQKEAVVMYFNAFSWHSELVGMGINFFLLVVMF
jgi:hypothetical protein